MADRPGHLLYHSRSAKLMNGLDNLRPELRAHIESHYPTCTGAPDTFESPNDTSWTYFKKVLDARAEPREKAESLHPRDRRPQVNLRIEGYCQSGGSTSHSEASNSPIKRISTNGA